MPLHGVYGGAASTDAVLDARPELRGYTRASVRGCLLRYALTGWTGRIPEVCRGRIIVVPVDVAPLLWGWPRRFTARMRDAGTAVVLLGPLQGEGFSSGIDDDETLDRVPKGFNGFVWTNRIEAIGPRAASR